MNTRKKRLSPMSSLPRLTPHETGHLAASETRLPFEVARHPQNRLTVLTNPGLHLYGHLHHRSPKKRLDRGHLIALRNANSPSPDVEVADVGTSELVTQHDPLSLNTRQSKLERSPRLVPSHPLKAVSHSDPSRHDPVRCLKPLMRRVDRDILEIDVPLNSRYCVSGLMHASVYPKAMGRAVRRNHSTDRMTPPVSR